MAWAGVSASQIILGLGKWRRYPRLRKEIDQVFRQTHAYSHIHFHWLCRSLRIWRGQEKSSFRYWYIVFCTWGHRPLSYNIAQSFPPAGFQHPPSYSITTVAPRSFIVAMIFSASSLGTFSLSILGALSTNFLLSTKLRPSMLLTSLMTLALAVGSMPCSFRVKRFFSWAGAAASSASSTGAAAGAAAKPPTGRSGMLSLLCATGGQWPAPGCRLCAPLELPRHTLREETRSAVSSSVSLLIWSTMVSILGFGVAAASVELNRRDAAEERIICAETRGAEEARSWRAQLWAA